MLRSVVDYFTLLFVVHNTGLLDAAIYDLKYFSYIFEIFFNFVHGKCAHRSHRTQSFSCVDIPSTSSVSFSHGFGNT